MVPWRWNEPMGRTPYGRCHVFFSSSCPNKKAKHSSSCPNTKAKDEMREDAAELRARQGRCLLSVLSPTFDSGVGAG